MGVTIASSSLPLQQVRPAGAATGFNKALILYIINQYPSSCNAKKKERTVVIWIICYFAGAGVCKNRPEATKQASDSTCEGAGGGRGGRAKTNLFWPGGRKGWMPRAGAPKGERETLRGLFTHFFFFFFFFYTRRCRTVEVQLFVTPLHSRLSPANTSVQRCYESLEMNQIEWVNRQRRVYCSSALRCKLTWFPFSHDRTCRKPRLLRSEHKRAPC